MKKYDIEEEIQRNNDFVIEKAKNDSLLNDHIHLTPNEKYFRNDTSLLAVIKAKPYSDKCFLAHNSCIDPKTFIVPVFITIRNEFSPSCFIFDDESEKLCGDKNSEEYSLTEKYINENHYALIFRGSDDNTSYGLRFKYFYDAYEFVRCLDSFEDIFSFELKRFG